MEVEAATEKTIRAKDEAIKSRDQKISRLKEDLVHEKKRREITREDISGGSEASEMAKR